MTVVDVRLTWREVAVGAYIGAQRQTAAMRGFLKDKHGFNGEPWGTHIEGACGEMAAAKALNVYWTPTVNTFRTKGDVGDIQVRTRSKHEYELQIRPDDKQSDIFVLVTGRAPLFAVRGWYHAANARRDEWWHNYGNRPPAWFVPQSELRLLGELKATLARTVLLATKNYEYPSGEVVSVVGIPNVE